MARYLNTNNSINEYLINVDKVFIEIIGMCKSVNIKLADNYFVSLVEHIVGQQLSNKVTDVICGRLHTLCNRKVEPKIILDISEHELRNIGVSYSKIGYLKNLSSAIESKKIVLENINNLDNKDIITILTSVKGIGQWTAEMFLIFALGREDVFSLNDTGLQKAILNSYKIDGKLTKQRLIQISEKWQPYRTYASLYLWDLLNKGIY